MNYKCQCIPIQEYPHIVKTSHTKCWYFTLWLPFYYRNKIGNTLNRIPLLRIRRIISPSKSCDNHPVPEKEWDINGFKFGKIIY